MSCRIRRNLEKQEIKRPKMENQCSFLFLIFKWLSLSCLLHSWPTASTSFSWLYSRNSTRSRQGRRFGEAQLSSSLFTPTTFSSQATQLFVWAHTNTLLFIMLIWHCRSWEGETAVLVWPWAHPSLVPASLHSIPPPPSPPWFHISLPLCLQHC